MTQDVINCPACGGVIARGVDVDKIKIRCPHCGEDLIIKTKLQVEVYEPQKDTLTRES